MLFPRFSPVALAVALAGCGSVGVSGLGPEPNVSGQLSKRQVACRPRPLLSTADSRQAMRWSHRQVGRTRARLLPTELRRWAGLLHQAASVAPIFSAAGLSIQLATRANFS
jgi:hypothetical protein